MDASSQYINFFDYFRNIFLGDNSIFYCLGKSIGGEMYGMFAYYLVSPYNFITLLFNKSNIIFAFDLILILKTASTSVTFIYFLNKKGEAKWTNLIFSCSYALSSYVITYGFNIMWLDNVILLPLVILGIDNLIKSKKIVLYTLSLSLSLITNYYIGFMICIFSSIYFLYKLIIENKKKDNLKLLGRFIIFSLIAILIACMILIPAWIRN